MLYQLDKISYKNIQDAILYFDQNRDVKNILSESIMIHKNEFGGTFLQLKNATSIRLSYAPDKVKGDFR